MSNVWKIETIFVPFEANAFKEVFKRDLIDILLAKLKDEIADYYWISWELVEEWSGWQYSEENYPDLVRWRDKWQREGYKLIEIYFEFDYSSLYIAVNPRSTNKLLQTVKLLTKMVELSL